MYTKCDGTGKRSFPTKGDALAAKNSRQIYVDGKRMKRRVGSGKECRAYSCDLCGGWHLSSMAYFPNKK